MAVYAVNENPRLDYSDAERFGEVIFLTTHEFQGKPGSLLDQQTLTMMRAKMQHFNPEKDHLLLTGSPLMMGFAYYLAMGISQKLSVLRWDNRAFCYAQVWMEDKA